MPPRRSAHDDRSSDLQGSRSTTSTSRSLLARLRDDDSAAWDKLVHLYTPLVYHWCLKLGLPEQEAADVVQEVFLSVAKNIEQFRNDRPGDTFRGWLRTIARNKVFDHYRRRQAQPSAAGGTDAQILLSQLPESDDLAELEHPDEAGSQLFRRALALIRQDFEERTWQAFWQVVVEGRSPSEVAESLDMRPGTVRVAKCRVLQRLRQELGDVIE